jgi:hypothetical protein
MPTLYTPGGYVSFNVDSGYMVSPIMNDWQADATLQTPNHFANALVVMLGSDDRPARASSTPAHNRNSPWRRWRWDGFVRKSERKVAVMLHLKQSREQVSGPWKARHFVRVISECGPTP